jgi:para-nitrobenzyl esterase
VADDFDALGSPLTNAKYAAATDAVFDGFAPFVLEEYPLPASPPADAASLTLGESSTDGIFACPERNGVQLLSKYVTTYAYELNDENAYLIFDLFPGISLSFTLGAPHFSEVPYLFDVFFTPSDFSQPGQESLSEAMISYWTHFAATGDPNSPGEPAWSPYSSMADQFQSFVPPTPTVEPTGSFDSNHMCSTFWNRLRLP